MRDNIIILFLAVIISSYAQTTTDKEYKITSVYFKEERTIKVHLPKDFKENEKLPVIYVFDAQWTAYFNLVSSSIDYLTEIRELPKSIVVGIYAEKRQFEFTPEPVNEDWKMPSLGGAKGLENHLLKEVFPMIDSLFAIQPFRTAIGHSLGGTFVLNSLVDSPTLFNALIAISPNLQLDDEEIVLKIAKHINKIKQTNKFLFVTIGTKGEPDTSFLPPIKKLDSVMSINKSATLHWNFRVYKGFTHATTPIESVHNALLLFSKKWKISENEKQKMMRSGNVLESFHQFYTKLSAWAGYTVSPTKNDYLSFIGFLETHKKYTDIIQLTKDATKRFSKTSRFYNIIAESYLELGKRKAARKYLRKAVAVLKKESFEYEGDKKYFKKLYQRNLEKTK